MKFQNKVYQDNEVTALYDDDLIGVGTYRKVYKVKLTNGEIVVVKKLSDVANNDRSCDNGFGTKVWKFFSIIVEF